MKEEMKKFFKWWSKLKIRVEEAEKLLDVMVRMKEVRSSCCWKAYRKFLRVRVTEHGEQRWSKHSPFHCR